MPAWSTDHLPPHDRFEYWREVVTRGLLGADAEIEAERRLGFTGRARASAVGAAHLIESAVSAHTMCAAPQAVERRASEGNLYIWYLVHGGGAVAVEDRDARITAGAVVTGRSYVPATYRPDLSLFRPGGCSRHRRVMIPRCILDALPTMHGKLVTVRHGSIACLDVLLRSYLETFVEQAPRLSGGEADVAVRTLAHLAVGARGAVDVRDETGMAAIREALLTRAHRLIEQELHRADLNPTRVAACLGISVRKLHGVFEPSGVSFCRHLLARRLARADRLLREAPHQSVTEVAYASGFDSLSTFFRCYRAAYRAAPGERRAETGRVASGSDPLT